MTLLLALWLVVGAGPRGSLAAPRGSRVATAKLENYQRQHQDLREQVARELEDLARRCEERQLALPAVEVRALARPPRFDAVHSTPLPDEAQPVLPPILPPDEEWRLELQRIRERHAGELYRLSRNVLHSDLPGYAYQLVRETAWYHPDHEQARRILGYVRHTEAGPEGTRVLWTTPFVAEKLRDGEVWDDRFGWLPRSHVARYEAGERLLGERWMTAAQEAEIRRDFEHAWEVRTEHYLVKTNHSLEAGVEIARKLETFHHAFHEVFAPFFTTPEQMKQLFNSARGRKPVVDKPHEVHFYATRQEYNERLVSKIPQIAVTNGLYYTGDRIAYFFHDPEGNNDAPLYHEASHQLFYEASPVNRPIAEQAHFWIIEGIACYMESFQPHEDGSYSLGDPRFIRFHWARHRLLEENYHVPFAQFAALGLREFQSGETAELQKRYSEASGLAHFFMHYDGGRYRDALVRHLIELYNADPRRPVSPLWAEALANVPPNQLDREYADHIRAMDAQARQLAAEPPTAGP